MLRSLKIKAFGCVAKDTTSISLAERKLEVWGKRPPKKKNYGKKMGITRPRPYGRVTKASFRNYIGPFKCVCASIVQVTNKAHYRQLPVVLTYSTLDKYFYLTERANQRHKNCDNILRFCVAK